jgi:hypothetical protein
MLKRVQAEVRQASDILAGCVHTEDAAGLFRAVGMFVEDLVLGRVAGHAACGLASI